MRRGRYGWRYGLAGVGLILMIAALIGIPAFLKPLLRKRDLLAGLMTTPVRRVDLTATMTASGRVDSSEQTVIECRLERLETGVRGNLIGAGGASTILSIMPDGSEVSKGDVLCVLDSSEYEEILRQQIMTVDRCRADHLGAELTLDVARTALQEYRDGILIQNTEQMEAKIALSQSEMERARERLRWTKRMNGKGYFPKSQVTNDELTLDRSANELEVSRENLRMFEKFFAPKYLHILESEILGAEAILGFQDARLKRHEERLEKFKQQVENCTIRAPHDGFLIHANEFRQNVVIEPGAMVRERQRLFYLPNLASMEVETMLHESVVSEVQPGMPAKVRIESLPDRLLEGHVESIAPLPGRQDFFSDVNYFVGKVKLDAIPRGLKPGMSAEVSIRTMQRPDVLTIPTEALTIEKGRDVCYVATEDHVERRHIKLGQHTRDLLEVTEGLDEGEEVVLDPRSTDVAELANAERPAE